MAILHLLHGFADAVESDLLLLGRVAPFYRVYGDEAGPHSTYIVEEVIDHHSEVGTVFAYQMDQNDAVHAAEGMVGDGDERSGREAGEHLLVVDTELKLEFIVDKMVGEGDARVVTPAAVDGVYLVDGEEMHDSLHELFMFGEGGHGLLDVVEVDDVGAYLALLIGGIFHRVQS